MKYITVKTINELTHDELIEFLKNKIVQEEIVIYAFEQESYFVNEILDYIKDSLKDYSIGAFAYYNYINVDLKKTGAFINGMNELQNDFLLIDSLNFRELLSETEKIYNEYISSDMYSDEYIELENNLVENTSELANILLDKMVVILEYFRDFKTVELESDYIEDYLDFYYDTEVAISNKGVTFITY